MAIVPSVFTLRISLLGSRPEIWRRVLVSGSVRLDRLHLVFQDVMGWTNSHLHCFQIDGSLYGMRIEDWSEVELYEVNYKLADLIGPGGRFLYEYDFGDSWEHEVIVERIEKVRSSLKVAVCLEGENACPPEDCGGVPGYSYLLEVLTDPSHEEYKSYRTWVGKSFSPALFNLAQTNVVLQRPT